MFINSKLIFIVVLFLNVGLSQAQGKKEDSTVFKSPYLDQKSPGMTPEVFAPGIVSSREDGKYLFYISLRAGSYYTYWIDTKIIHALKPIDSK